MLTLANEDDEPRQSSSSNSSTSSSSGEKEYVAAAMTILSSDSEMRKDLHSVRNFVENVVDQYSDSEVYNAIQIKILAKLFNIIYLVSKTFSNESNNMRSII